VERTLTSPFLRWAENIGLEPTDAQMLRRFNTVSDVMGLNEQEVHKLAVSEGTKKKLIDAIQFFKIPLEEWLKSVPRHPEHVFHWSNLIVTTTDESSKFLTKRMNEGASLEESIQELSQADWTRWCIPPYASPIPSSAPVNDASKLINVLRFINRPKKESETKQ